MGLQIAPTSWRARVKEAKKIKQLEPCPVPGGGWVPLTHFIGKEKYRGVLLDVFQFIPYTLSWGLGFHATLIRFYLFWTMHWIPRDVLQAERHQDVMTYRALLFADFIFANLPAQISSWPRISTDGTVTVPCEHAQGGEKFVTWCSCSQLKPNTLFSWLNSHIP